MNILYLTQRYAEGNGGYQYELLPVLTAAGHQVTLVAANADLSRGAPDGVEVLSINPSAVAKTGLLQKAFNQFTMPVQLRGLVRKRLRGRMYDIVLVATPPITFASLFAYCKKHFKCKAVLMLKDIFPQGAADLKYIQQNGCVYRLYARIEKKLYKTADRIGYTSPANREYLLRHYPYLNADKLVSMPNAIRERDDTPDCAIRGQLDLGQDEILCLFGGNLGVPQHIELLLEAFRQCRAPGIRFVLCGAGSEYDHILKYVDEHALHHVTMIRYLPYNQYERLLSAADICLLTLTPAFTIPNTPDKLTAYLAYGKPIVAATDEATDIRQILLEANAGLWSHSDDPASFVRNIQRLIDEPDLRRTMGNSGRLYCRKHLRVEAVIAQIERIVGK